MTLVGYGSLVGNVGAQAQILVNGKAVSGLMEFKPAADPSDYQTFTVSFDTPGLITSIDINLANATPGRALHIKDFQINGVALTPADAANASSPGTFDLYVHSIHVDTTNHQDWVTGASTDNDVIDGGAGDDVIAGGAGNDIIEAGDGIDTAKFSGNARDYDISIVNGQMVVSDRLADRDGTDHLAHLEFLQFADGVINASELFAGLANSSGATLQVLATDGAGKIIGQLVRYADGSDLYSFETNGSPAPQQPGNSDNAFESASPDAVGHLLGFLQHLAGGFPDQFTFDPSHTQVAFEGTARGAAICDIASCAGRDTFVFSETVRYDVAGHDAFIDHGHDASVALAGVTSLTADHLLFI